MPQLLAVLGVSLVVLDMILDGIDGVNVWVSTCVVVSVSYEVK